MSDAFDELKEEKHDAFDALEGEPGHAGANPYSEKRRAEDKMRNAEPPIPTGTLADAAKTWANKAAAGAGPQIEGAMGAAMQYAKDPNTAAMLQAAQLAGAKTPDDSTLLDAYRAVRDMGAKEHAASENTLMGKAVAPIGVMSTPIPIKPAAGMSVPERAWQSTKVGGGVGGLSALANSPADLTKMDAPNLERGAADFLLGVGGGGVTSAILGGSSAAAESPTRQLAEQQALRAAGLRAGIKDSLQKDLGITNMNEARQLGRQFLDEGLIPPVGSAESVAKRAQKLEGQAGNSIGAQLAVGQMNGPLSYDRVVKAAADPLQVAPGKSTAVADLASGKARDFVDAMERQGQATPGNWAEANRAKSDAWKSARFDDQAPMAAVLHRKSVGAARNNIEDQLREVNPAAADALHQANERFGVAADAQKLAEAASRRDAAKKGFGMPEILAMTGAGAGGMAGHPVTGGLAGLATALGAKAFDKWGHSTAARGADFLADRLANNTGGAVGGVAGSAGGHKLAEYLGEMEDADKWKKLQGGGE